MNHTKRSVGFREQIEGLLPKLKSPDSACGLTQDECDRLVSILTKCTTDNPGITNVGDGEAMFVLRAQDLFSADLVIKWADRFRTYIDNLDLDLQMVVKQRAQLMAKWKDATCCAASMREFPNRKYPD